MKTHKNWNDAQKGITVTQQCFDAICYTKSWVLRGRAWSNWLLDQLRGPSWWHCHIERSQLPRCFFQAAERPSHMAHHLWSMEQYVYIKYHKNSERHFGNHYDCWHCQLEGCFLWQGYSTLTSDDCTAFIYLSRSSWKYTKSPVMWGEDPSRIPEFKKKSFTIKIPWIVKVKVQMCYQQNAHKVSKIKVVIIRKM